MTMQIVLSLAAVPMPWFSVRTPWFVAWALAAVGAVAGGMAICMDGAQGWEGLGCLIIAIIAALLVLASIVVGIVRVVNTGGGKRPGNVNVTVTAAAICYGIAVLLIVFFVTMGR